jgi:transposase
MLGPVKPRRVDQPVISSLDSLVPANHFYRHLERTLDLSFVRDLVRDAYAAGGRPSIDPIVFCKLHLILFFEGIRSERQLIATASLNLAHRWYLGYALDEPLPDHSSLTRIRSFDEPYLERARGYHETPAYRKAMRKRSVWVEPLFGEAKQWHGLRRFRLRGLDKVNIEGFCVAAGQNLKRWLARTGWGRRQAPCGSLLAPSRHRSALLLSPP